MYLRLFTLLVFILPFALAVSGQNPVIPTVVPTAVDTGKGYLIGPGDEITAKVVGESEFDFVSTVDENGKIEVPFSDDPIKAQCLSERELRIESHKAARKIFEKARAELTCHRSKESPSGEHIRRGPAAAAI
jgi:hypothetical protein